MLIEQYHRLVADGHRQHDAAQLAALSELERLRSEIISQSPPNWFGRLLGQRNEHVRGVYLWGGVGRGKTFLMDLLFAALPAEIGWRTHFHRFMRDVHSALRDFADEGDPLVLVALRYAKRARVIGLDELLVHDIGDAMILHRLLEALIDHGVTLVTTANLPPSELYRGGLQRERFLPAIELLKGRLTTVEVAAATDYRARALRAEGRWWPLGDDQPLRQQFGALAGHPPSAQTLNVNGRAMSAIGVGADVAWFSFATLCESPRSAHDYIDLAAQFKTLIVSEIPQMGVAGDDSARRFVTLIDELYDRRIALIASAAAAPTELYRGDRLRFEFERTASRLLEMQGDQYLAERAA